MLYIKPTHARLILTCGETALVWELPLVEAAWLGRQLLSIMGGEPRLFRLGEKVTFARYERGKLQISLQPVNVRKVA